MSSDDRRLKDAKAFDTVFKGNQYRVSSEAFLFLAMDNELEQSRIGLVIAKKTIRLASQRNRVKRAIRECFRELFLDFSPNIDLVVLSRTGVNSREKVILNQQVLSLMKKLKLKINPCSGPDLNA